MSLKRSVVKKFLLIPFFCSLLINTYTQTTFYVDIASPSEINCGDSVQLVAELVTPVSLQVISAGYDPDGIGLQVVNKSTHAIVKDLYIWVPLNATVDTTLLLKEGSYTLKWMYAGAEVLNPTISGTIGNWYQADNRAQLDFNVDKLVDGNHVTYDWPGLGSDHNSVKIAPGNTETYKVIATYQDSTSVEDSIKVTVNPLTATAGDTTFSCGNTVQLNVATNYTGPGTLTYFWTPSLGLNATNIANPVVSSNTEAGYFVEVNTPNGCSATDSVKVNPLLISFSPGICYVTVNENDKNVIIWKNELNPAIDSFFVFRESSDQTDQYDLIGKMPVNEAGTYVDIASNARVQSNKYKISVKDVCGFTTEKSPEHKTMHLTINRGISNIWNLIWEQYGGIQVSSYRIYRGTTKADLELIGTSSGSNTTYTDETAPEGDVFYQVEVVLPVDCSLEKSASYSTSRSNIINSAEATTGIESNSMSKLIIYPNPAKDKLYIRNGQSGISAVFIYDLQGNLVLSRNIVTDLVDISALASGIYTVRVINTGNVIMSKLIKEKF
jgi:hypothetical protein